MLLAKQEQQSVIQVSTSCTDVTHIHEFWMTTEFSKKKSSSKMRQRTLKRAMHVGRHDTLMQHALPINNWALQLTYEAKILSLIKSHNQAKHEKELQAFKLTNEACKADKFIFCCSEIPWGST